MDRPNPDEIDLFDDDDFNESNESNDIQVAEDPAMAAVLGFTSFGGTKPTDDDDNGNDGSRPSKKRRFNPHSDNAVIATDEPPLIKGKPQPPKDEITYSDSDNNDFELDVTARPAEFDSDAPPTPSGTSTPALAAASQSQPTGTRPQNGRGAQSGRGGNRGGGGARGGGAGRGGPHNPLWYVDYYDASSNENPWEGMEKFKGLEAVGTWLSRLWDREKKEKGEGASGVEGGGEGVAATAG
ncbi:hypothetical protein C8A01DRAFT_14329 [Parachaetomium inaequale]|uniref:Uncharacterized protein n=1 Tax=Parachaetomium inaequale TaxID=2588326 RepID=A0AAN6SU04_9PEZI|nr:hypothetical protein C8A01DRAFT_14329 [Parachaetomium inaequale]